MEKSQLITRFEAVPYILEGQMIVRLPQDVSKELPSRGQVAVEMTVNDHNFLRVLEPDGNWGHWFRVDSELQDAIGIGAGTSMAVAISPTKNWPEPTVPDDFQQALTTAPQKVKDKWQDITAMARWEWIRWVNATGSKATRAIRIEKSISKLNGTHRRPCCFNLAACTEPSLSKSGRLIGVMSS